MRRRSSTVHRVPLALLLTALCFAALACRAGTDRTVGAATALATATPAATAAAIPVRVENVVALADPAERAAALAALAGSGAEGVTVSDEPLAGGTRFVQRAWAVVTAPRSNVLTLTPARLRAVLEGRIDNWAELGGTPAPLAVAVPTADASTIARLFAPDGLAARVTRMPDGAPVTPDAGALALVPIDAVTPGMLTLVVDGHDPLRDPARTAPLRADRWVRAPDPATASAVAAALGWDGPLNGYDPAGVLATGDFVYVRCARELGDAAGGPAEALRAVRPLLQVADLTIVALESGLTAVTTPTPCTGTLTLVAPAAVAQALADAGVDVVTRAANHAFDCWDACDRESIRAETDAALAAAGIAHVGTGDDLATAREPLLVEAGGVRFAILSYDDVQTGYDAGDGVPGVPHLNLDTLGEDVGAAAERADHVIVAVHWGVEYTADPTDRQRAAARIAADAGAALVIGNHPHWVQAVERIEETLVIYALGNFVFDQTWSEETQQGALLEVGFTRDRMLGFRLRPLAIVDGFRPVLVDPAGDTGHAIFERMWAATDRLALSRVPAP